MPTPIERVGTAIKQFGPGAAIGGAAFTTGVGLQTTAAGLSVILPAAGPALIPLATFAAPVLVVGGVLLAGGAILAGAYKALRPKSREKADDMKMELKELDNKYWSCHIHRVGVIGIKRSGKTEIKTKLRHFLKTGERDTKNIETHILKADDGIFVALVDGQGAERQERSQQFEIVDQADVLVIVLDHNDSDVSRDIDRARLREHDRFLQNIQDRFKKYPDKDRRVIFVLNKRDLWSQVNDPSFTSWFQTHVQQWSDKPESVGEASMEMSTKQENDIKDLKRKIVAAARKLKP
jgi:hypothetical protein